jgi:hypothetical protein
LPFLFHLLPHGYPMLEYKAMKGLYSILKLLCHIG